VTYEDVLRMFFKEHHATRVKHKVKYESAI